MMKKLLLLFSTVVLLVFTAFAQFTSTQDGPWTDAATWGGGGTPGASDDVTINHAVTYGGDLTYSGYMTINSAGTLTMSDGSLTIQSDFDHYGTLNVGDGVEDYMHVDGGFFYIGDGSVTDISGYYMQDNSGELWSENSVTATIDVGTADDLNDNTNNVFYIEGSSLYDLDGADIDITLPNGNSGTADEVVIENGAFSTAGSGDFTLGSGGTPTREVTDWSMSIGSGQVLNNVVIDVGAGGTVYLSQDDTRTGTAYIEFKALNLTSGTFKIQPSAGLYVTNTDGITGSGALELVSTSSGTGEFAFEGSNVSAKVNRYITGNKWHQICFAGDPGSLVSMNTIKASTVYMDNNPDVWIMEFDRVNTEWNFITDLNDDLELWWGYTLKGAADFTFSYTEDMTSATHNVSDPGAQLDKFAIITNPYPSSYDAMSDGTLDGLNIYNQIWTWDPATTSYAYYTGGTGGTYSGVVAQGQSFFVKASITGTATYAIAKGKRTFGEGNNFLKNGNTEGWEDDFGIGTYAMFKVLDGNSKDISFVNFGEDATTDFEDGFDGFKKFGDETSPQLYITEGDFELSIDYLPELELAEERVIQMNFIPGIDGEQTLMANLNSLPETSVILEDLKTGTFHNYNETEAYDFSASKEDDPARFLVHFVYGPTGIENPAEDADHISIYAFNKAIYLGSNNSTPQISNVKLYDIMGRELLNKDIEVASTTKIPVNINNAYVIVKVVTNNEVTTTKVFVK